MTATISAAVSGSGSAEWRIRAPGTSATRATSAAAFAAAVRWSTDAPRSASSIVSAPASIRSTTARVRAFVAHRPCTLDGRITVTGSPLSRAARSTATFEGA